MNIDSSIRAKYYGDYKCNKSFIVLHYTANSGIKATAKGNANFFANNPNQSSAHYVVDEGDTAYLCVPEDRCAWAVGGRLYPATQGGAFYGKCTNDNSISIEMVSHTDENGAYYIPSKTIDNALALTLDIQKRWNIPTDHIIRHYDVNGKPCPWCWTNMNGYSEEEWLRFKNRLEYNQPEELLYRVQIGAFASRYNAENMLKAVKDKGFGAFIRRVNGLWKVQVGAFANKDNAISYLAVVKNKGFDGFITW